MMIASIITIVPQSFHDIVWRWLVWRAAAMPVLASKGFMAFARGSGMSDARP
jgi:hypothetical protein